MYWQPELTLEDGHPDFRSQPVHYSEPRAVLLPECEKTSPYLFYNPHFS